MSSIVIQGDTSGSITVEAPSVAGTHTLTLPKATGNIATDTTVGLGTKNRIINGDMRIDQRNAGASVSVSSYGYVLDRFGFNVAGGGVFNAQQTTTAPTEFSNSQQLTVTTIDSSIASGDTYSLFHKIEGYNTSHLELGTANAKTFTLSFWVRSSVTGTFGVGFCNNAFNRSYVSTYTIDVADTWEKKTITVAGDTSGTWATNNSIGLNISFDLGSGTNFDSTPGSWSSGNFFRTSGCVNWIANTGATFYITGVQLELGENATPFEHRMYSQELAMCQRYCYVDTGANCFVAGAAGTSTNMFIKYVLPSPMRATPTLSFISLFASQIIMSDQYSADFAALTPTILTAPAVANHSGRVQIGGFTGLTVGRWYGGSASTTGKSIFSAEL